jgi:hypothetical protein
MRIICDHCSQPISGTVKRVAGNFNFHLVCAEVGKEAKQESTVPSWRQESSASALIESQGVVPEVLREME